ncbi:hypothetical protein SUGI_0503220 [Cryptomeria japonica]|nr:hypothetical protein SUGI_0503220 [Cryptomeria japonica]
MVIGYIEIDFLGLHLDKGKIKLQSHVLKRIQEFPDVLTNKKQIQRFLGCLSYVAPFYKELAKDKKKIQDQLQESSSGWNPQTTKAAQQIKTKCQSLPSLQILAPGNPLILYTDASDTTWFVVLIQKFLDKRKKICGY